jgi:outer membrane protein assembly factor BamE (lipoprotein component of BamABCDE complex)
VVGGYIQTIARARVAIRNLTFLLILSVFASGCSLALGAERVIRGREVDVEAFESKLRTGMSADEIEEAFGPPFLRREVRDGEEWRYLEVRSLRACRPFLLFIPLAPTPRRKTEIRLKLGSAGLEAAWLDTYRGEKGNRVRRSLLNSSTVAE